jgi:rhamnogalacturonyl hydrolase YesR
MKHLSSVAVAAAITLLGATTSASAAAGSPAAATLPQRGTVIAAAALAADYYQPTLAHTDIKPTNGWSWATYEQGLHALYEQTGRRAYQDDGMAWGVANSWALPTTPGESDPDTIKAGQTYFALHGVDPTASLAAINTTMASDLASLPVSAYWWIDALFMGLPDWTLENAQTGNTAYRTKRDTLFAWTRDQGATNSLCAGKTVSQPGLFNASAGLWYRDCTTVGKPDTNGDPIYWSRGNGWVIAAMAEVLATMSPGDPGQPQYTSMFKTMAAALAPLQGSDGMWRSSLLDPSLFPNPETSGTALISYALAYGIEAGLLDPATYLPVIAHAWNGLTTLALQPSGFLTDCQGPGSAPGTNFTGTAPRTAPTSMSSGSVNDDSAPYCVGAFLMAASEVAQLAVSQPPQVFASDSFGRTVSGGLGTADLGGPWTTTGATTANTFAVSGGTGQLTIGTPGTSTTGYLGATTQTNADITLSVALNTPQTGGGSYVSILGRRINATTDYELKLHYTATGAVTAALERVTAGTQTVLTTITLPGLTYTAGHVLQTRLRVVGTNPTTISASVWPQGTSQPTGWQLTTTDTTATLQNPGTIGITPYLSSTFSGTPETLTIDNLTAGPQQ